ncbi:MAG: SufD family Fe-S cluster assembly protein [Alphaproteobacteria bacterium]|nr:SufD family Fe-S cluster assembly protein [Alphaproteobacteria bacterium]
MSAPYQAAFEAVADALPGNGSWRRAAMQGLTFPGRRDEAWRFTSAARLLATEHAPVEGSVELEGAVPLLEGPRDAVAKLGRAAGTEGFQGLNAAFFRGGALVHAPAGARVGPVRVKLGGADGLTTPRVLVVAEARARVEVLVEHTLGSGLHVPVIEVFAGTTASVSLTHVVRGEGGHAVVRIAADLGRDARIDVRSFVLGGSIVRVELTSTGQARGALDARGLVLGRGKQHADHHLELQHASPGMASHQLFRNILDDRARAVFTGQVTVAPGVTGTEATQQANTLLLADGASAVVRPWLQIDNDEVVASHGATVGRLDDEALFYLRQRGLTVSEASRLLTGAFASEVVASVPDAFREELQAAVDAWLA